MLPCGGILTSRPLPTPHAGSVCSMRRNVHSVIPEEDFRVTAGEDSLIEYTFNTGTARHLFCKRCGITPFYRPRSNPHHYAGECLGGGGGGER